MLQSWLKCFERYSVPLYRLILSLGLVIVFIVIFIVIFTATPVISDASATALKVAAPVFSAPTVIGQIPLIRPPTGPPPLPVGVERRGTVEATGVRLDGQELFKIASPTVLNRSDPGSQIPVEIRARQIESNLDQLIVDGSTEEMRLDPTTMQVAIERLNGQPVLFVNQPTLARARVLLTVTDSDAQYHAIGKDLLAERWQKILERELREALALRQPEAFSQQVAQVIRTLMVALLLTLLLSGLWTVWRRRKKRLERQQAAEIAASALEPGLSESEPMRRLFHDLRRYFDLQRRLQIAQFLQWLTFWLIVAVWVVGVAHSLNAFPQTRHFASRVVTVPMLVLATWFSTGLFNRLTDLGIDRYLEQREQDRSLTAANCQRMATIANVLKGLKTVLAYAVSTLWVLQWLNLIPGSILALGALVALAISFAAQSLVKDLVNGFLILLEDHFRIGDQIRTGTAFGLVENLNLRITQIRSSDGNLITLPNSLITQVENMSRSWARADFQIEVAYDTDVDYALAVVRETAQAMAQDPDWETVILDAQELLGVEQISHSGIVIRIWVRTMPLKQWITARELRRRLKIAFDSHQIQIGIPQHLLHGSPSGILNDVGKLQQIE